MTAPLSGTRVLDCTASIAGPSCTLFLPALGADVEDADVSREKIESIVADSSTRAEGES